MSPTPLSLASFAAGIALLSLAPLGAQDRHWTPPPVLELVSLIGSDPAAAGQKIRGAWGSGSLREGRHLVERTSFLIAAESEQPLALYHASGEKVADLVRLDDAGLQAYAADLGNCVELAFELRAAEGEAIHRAEVRIEWYPDPPEAIRDEALPRGELHPHRWTESTVFPDTVRDLLVYIPAQYDGSEPAALMVFQDGLRHADPDRSGGLRAPVVFDHLIASDAMPVTVGVFIDPGSRPGQEPGSRPQSRGFEYDSLGDAYVRFLLEEILPYVTEAHGLKLSDDPKLRAIAGGSSGAACAWTAAWERPDAFGKVLGWVGSFVDLRGGHVYPSLIRKTERKPIRVALLGESQDVENQFGHWPLANQQMEAALAFQRYDYRYWWGEGFHGSRHAAAMLPEMLRWLWADVAAGETR